jgi:hypothetical protein
MYLNLFHFSILALQFLIASFYLFLKFQSRVPIQILEPVFLIEGKNVIVKYFSLYNYYNYYKCSCYCQVVIYKFLFN